MNHPRVMAMMLTADRHEMTKRAVGCFEAQTYQNKSLLIYDSGQTEFSIRQDNGIYHEHRPEDRGLTIGALRNLAMVFAHPLCLNADIIVTFDSDDVSHPNRITEQVALLESSGADCVGYNEALFWRDSGVDEGTGTLSLEDQAISRGPVFAMRVGEAWLYSLPRSNYALGTSLCYWRKTWETKPFEDTSAGEDLRFIEGLNVKAIAGAFCPFPARKSVEHILANPASCETPYLIASVHGGNTHLRIDERSEQWKRVPKWDNRLREIMAL